MKGLRLENCRTIQFLKVGGSVLLVQKVHRKGKIQHKSLRQGNLTQSIPECVDMLSHIPKDIQMQKLFYKFCFGNNKTIFQLFLQLTKQ